MMVITLAETSEYSFQNLSDNIENHYKNDKFSHILYENRKHIALILKKIHFNPANTKAHCPSFGLRLPNGPLNFPLLSFTPCRLSTLNTELRLLYPLTAMMSSKE